MLQNLLLGFSFSINIANFEAFLSVFKLTTNPLFLKSVCLDKIFFYLILATSIWHIIFFSKCHFNWVWSNSPALNGQTSIKCVINFFFHSNWMKLGDVLVHIDNYNFTNLQVFLRLRAGELVLWQKLLH